MFFFFLFEYDIRYLILIYVKFFINLFNMLYKKNFINSEVVLYLKMLYLYNIGGNWIERKKESFLLNVKNF